MTPIPSYSTVLIDLDHTIFDFDASEVLAFGEALAVAGIDDAARHLATYRRLNSVLWAAAERGEILATEIRDLRFGLLAAELRLAVDTATVAAMADAFVAGLGMHGDLIPGARDVLAALAGTTRLAVVSNGLGEVVRSRLGRLGIGDHFDAVIVSSEVGVAKPGRGIFDVAFDRLGWPDPATALMVGDSLSSDIAGGTAYGIATCWYNPHRRSAGPGDVFTYEIAALQELPAIVGVEVLSIPT